jgi:succinoglycan biosynthesis transport protein ExoP
MLDKNISRYLQANKILDEPPFDEMEIGSQIYVLTSESVVIPVVRSLNLAHDPEFVGIPEASESEWSINKLIKIAGRFAGHTSEVAIDPDTALERRAVETFLKRLTVNREDVANVISVTFTSKDAEKAATIANALADTYLATTLETKLQPNKIASKLLQDRIIELRQQVGNADQAVREYKTSNNVTNSRRGLAYSEQIAYLNSRLIDARIAVIESKARVGHDQQSAAEGTPLGAVADNEVITRLRAQYLDLSLAAAEIENRVGPKHQAIIKLHERMARLAVAIRDEKKRISSAVPSEHELAKARYDELASAIDELTGDTNTGSQSQPTLRELESSAEAVRTLYIASLQKLNEINKGQAQSVPVQDARIITRAAPPLGKESKKPMAVFGGSIVFGLLLGVGAALVREFADRAFQTPEEVKTATNIYCGIMPTVEVRRGRIALLRGSTRPDALDEYVLDAPYSRFAETVRNIRVSVDAAHRANGDKVFCIVSSVANEGKTTILTNLAALMAASESTRLLVIDCDLHRRRLTTKLVPDAREGLMEAMDDPSRLARLVWRRERSGVHVLPCVLPSRVANAAELLGSPQMEKLLDAAREAYDFVIIEVPPIMSVVDVKVIERFVDRFIFVVEWGKTHRRLVQEALSEVEIIRDRLLCIVLNKADPGALRSIEAYKGARFGDYYDA